MNEKNRIGKWALFTLFLLICGSSFAQSVTVEAKIDSAQFLIGEQVKITLKASCNANQKIVFPHFKDTLITRVDVVESHQLETEFLNNKQRKVESRDYIITSIDSGLYYIPPFQIMVNGVKYLTKPLSIKVYTVPVDMKHPDKFAGPKDVMNPPFVWSDWSGVVYSSFLSVILLLLMIYFIVRLRDNKPIIRRIKVEAPVPPDKKALQHIEKLKSATVIEQEQQKEYYTELTEALRTYIKDRFGFNALEMTSSEIIEKLMSRQEDKNTFNDLKMLFQTADLVKFAKHAPMLNENDYNLVSAVSFINGTKVEEAVVKKIKPVEFTVEEKRSRKSRMALIIGITVFAVAITCIIAHIVLRIIDLI